MILKPWILILETMEFFQEAMDFEDYGISQENHGIHVKTYVFFNETPWNSPKGNGFHKTMDFPKEPWVFQEHHGLPRKR